MAINGERLAELVVSITADMGPLKSSLSSMGTRLKSTVERAAVSLGQTFSRAMATALKGGLAASLAGGFFSIRVASDAEEIRSKMATVLGELNDEGEKFAQTLSRKVGRSVIDIRKSLADFAAVFQPLGFSQENALALSKQVAQLSIDMASFSNTTDAEAAQALMSGLLGESEPLKRYGVVLNEAKVASELLAMGIKKDAKAITDVEKATARMNIIMRATVQAQGDAQRTAGSFANTWKSLQGTIKDLAGDLGQVLVPAATEVVKALRTWAQELGTHRKAFIEWGKTIGKTTGETITKLAKWITTNTDTIKGIATMVPKLAALAVGIKGLSVVFGGLGAVLGKSALATLLSPTGVLVLGVTALGAAFVHSRIKGQSWGDSIAELTARTLGFENAITRTNDALAIHNQSRMNMSAARAAIEGGAAATTPEELRAQIESLTNARDAEIRAAEAQEKNAKRWSEQAEPHSALGLRGWGAGAARKSAEGATEQAGYSRALAGRYTMRILAMEQRLATMLSKVTKPLVGGIMRDDAADAAYRAARARELGGGPFIGVLDWIKNLKPQHDAAGGDGGGKRSGRTTEYFDLAEYSRAMQRSLGGSPEEKAQQAMVKNGGKANDLLAQLNNKMGVLLLTFGKAGPARVGA